MKRVVVFGTTSFANTVSYYLENYTDWDIVAYVTDFANREDICYNRTKLINTNQLIDMFPPTEFEIVSGVGYNNMMNGRKAVYEKIKAMGYKMPNFIHPTVVLHNTFLGDGNLIFENVSFMPNAVLGNNNIMWSGAVIGHDTNIASHNQFSANSVANGNIKIEECCFLGANCTLKEGICIAHHTLVGAGAYVSKDTNPYDAIVPARSIVLKHKSTELI